ncbi:hypothetical protein [Paenibacillus durus]|uniref:hypothetical protein n=1 Tax=Paenibacillus durus TaxID=44251 RepID=UPI0006937323|nr:hypothetical protein [Paenibacillus durus]
MSKNQKRNQHKIKLFQFHEITESSGQLLAPEATQRTITVSDSMYLHHLKQVVAEIDQIADFTDAIFMLKADNIAEDDPAQFNLFERMLCEGIYYQGERYIRSIKSPAMGRTQRTEFIRKTLYDSLYNRITLGKYPNLTNINKWEAALGVSRSTAIPIPFIPRIVVIPDYKKDEIIEDVWKIEECGLDSEAQNLVQAEKRKQSAYFKAKKELKPSAEKLKQLKSVPVKYIEAKGELKHVPDQSIYKTFNGWDKEGRRVELDQIALPVRSAEYSGKLYPCYFIEQTEEIPVIPISQESIGLKRVEYPKYKNKDVQFFDGQGLMSFEFAEIIQQHLELKHPVNAVQGRLPYIKGNFIRFDIHKWFKEHHITEMIDIFNQPKPLIDEEGRPIDLIITKSCFKAWHRYIEGQEKPECIFENIAEYEKLLTHHHHTHFWIANYAKPSYQINPYTPLTYQYIHALNLTLDDLYKLASPILDVLKRILHGKNIMLHRI